MRRIATLACLGFLAAASLLAQSAPSPLVEDRLLREELALAKSPSLYFIIYLKSRMMSLRAGGLTLKEWKIAGVNAWGAAPLLEALTVEKKSTLYPPKRKEIIPTADEQADQEQTGQKKADQQGKPAKKEDDQKNQAFELEALELKDMPPIFTIFLSDGTSISIRPQAQKFFPRIASFGHSLSWYLWVPLKNLWFHLKKKPFSVIDIKLETKEDVQSIYWSLADGTKGLIFPL